MGHLDIVMSCCNYPRFPLVLDSHYVFRFLLLVQIFITIILLHVFTETLFESFSNQRFIRKKKDIDYFQESFWLYREFLEDFAMSCMIRIFDEWNWKPQFVCILRSYGMKFHTQACICRFLIPCTVIYKADHRSYNRAKTHMVGENLLSQSFLSSRIFTKPFFIILKLGKHAFWSEKIVFDRAKIPCSIIMIRIQISL